MASTSACASFIAGSAIASNRASLKPPGGLRSKKTLALEFLAEEMPVGGILQRLERHLIELAAGEYDQASASNPGPSGRHEIEIQLPRRLGVELDLRIG